MRFSKQTVRRLVFLSLNLCFHFIDPSSPQVMWLFRDALALTVVFFAYLQAVSTGQHRPRYTGVCVMNSAGGLMQCLRPVPVQQVRHNLREITVLPMELRRISGC